MRRGILMPAKEYDQKGAVEGWGTSTQLVFGPPIPFRFRTTAATFNKDMRRKGNEDILFLVITGEVLDIDTLNPVEDWKTFEMALKCGPGWETPDNGRTAQNKDRTVFDGRTAAGEFVDRVVTDSALKGLFKELVDRGLSTQADVWVGLDLTIGQSKHKGNEGQGIPDYARHVPVEYHGTFTVEEMGEKQRAKNEELTNTLTALAGDSESFDAFQNEAMALGIKDSKLLDDVMDESEDGFYARARATSETE